MVSDPLFIITGPPRHGKDTFGVMLGEALGTPEVGATSDVIYDELARRLGVRVEALKRIPKEDLRPALIELGDLMTENNPAALSDALRGRFLVISGVRRVREFLFAPEPKILIWMSRAGGPVIKDNTDFALRDLAQEVVEFQHGDFAGMREFAEIIATKYRDLYHQFRRRPVVQRCPLEVDSPVGLS
jgi:hypothetical protein